MDATAHEIDRAALFTQLVCSTINLDYAARALKESSAFTGNAKRRLNLLVASSDSFLVAATDKFDMAEGTAVNTLSTLITEHQRLLLQCNPAQIRASLEHVAWMVQTGATPAPLPPVFKREAYCTASIS